MSLKAFRAQRIAEGFKKYRGLGWYKELDNGDRVSWTESNDRGTRYIRPKGTAQLFQQETVFYVDDIFDGMTLSEIRELAEKELES